MCPRNYIFLENQLMKRDHSGDSLCNTHDSFPNCLPVPSPLAAGIYDCASMNC